MFEFLSSQHRVVELNGHPINLDEIETVLLAGPIG